MASDNPDEVVLAILGDFVPVGGHQVVSEILRKLKELNPGTRQLQKNIR